MGVQVSRLYSQAGSQLLRIEPPSSESLLEDKSQFASEQLCCMAGSDSHHSIQFRRFLPDHRS